MVIIQKSKDLLRRTNDRESLDVGLDIVSERIIQSIANQCKGTVYREEELQYKKYESTILQENVYSIVRLLIFNGRVIPKEVMDEFALSDYIWVGVHSDIELCDVIDSEDDGKRKVVTGNAVIDLKNEDNEILELIQQEIFTRFAREFVLANKDVLPPVGKLMWYMEKVFHGRETREDLERRFEEILKSRTEYGEEMVKRTVQYYLDYMYDSMFKHKLLNKVRGDKTLVLIGDKKKKVSFSNLLERILEECKNIINDIPDINQILEDIYQIHADVEAQLIAYSTDITSLDANQIEQKIKEINRVSLIDTQLQEQTSESGYKNKEVVMGPKSKKPQKTVSVKKTPECMKRLAKDIQEFVQNGNSMKQEEYLKRAVQLQYRFIRIHPFRDSNGRTSRALLNMMTVPRGILVEIPKEKKKEFGRASITTHRVMDSKGYFEALESNADEIDRIEAENTDVPLYDFIMKNCVVDINAIQETRDSGSEQVVVKNAEIREDEDKS